MARPSPVSPKRRVAEQVSRLVAEAPDLLKVERRFTLRAREGFAENFGPALIARVALEAPGVQLHFMPKLDRQSTLGPELRAQAMFRDRFIGVVRAGHPLSR